MRHFSGYWVREKDDKKRLTEGRVGVLVHQDLKGPSGEIFAVSVLHLSLQNPVLKAFERVKVQMRKLCAFTGTSSCGVKEIDRKFKQLLRRFGVRRNARGHAIRCCRKSAVPQGLIKRNSRGRNVRCTKKTRVQDPVASKELERGRKRPLCQVDLTGARVGAKDSGARSPKMMTPPKKARKSLGSCFSDAKLSPKQLRLTRYKLKTVEVVFHNFNDVAKDDSTYLAAMSTQHLDPCDWKPCGKPRIVDSKGIIYDGKPGILDGVAFPLTVALKLTKVE